MTTTTTLNTSTVGNTISVTLPSTTYVLDGVKDEDKNLVQDVLDLLRHSQKHCKTWSVKPERAHYEIIGCMDSQADEWEIPSDDLQLIHSLDNLRIPFVSIKMSRNIIQIKVTIIPRSERVVIQNTEILRVAKKRRFWGLF